MAATPSRLAVELGERVRGCVDPDRLVATAKALVDVSSPTGHELDMAHAMRELFGDAGLTVVWQEVEDARPNVVGTLEGTGRGPTLMFNGHMDTSYSGREPQLHGAGFEPCASERDGHIFGLGVSNMKGALAAYVEAVRALRDAGVRLEGDLIVAAVVGEIEKSQWGDDYRGRDFRGYSTGSRHLVTHGMVSDMCLLGEPTGQEIVLSHYGALWCRLSVRGPFVHTAFSRGRLAENSIVRMHGLLGAVLDWIPSWEEAARHGGLDGLVNLGAMSAGHPWRVSRTPERADLFLDLRVPPDMSMARARHEFRDLVMELRGRHPELCIEWETFLSAPGAELAADDPLVRAIERHHEDVFGDAPVHASAHWFSDASSLSRYGVRSVNYGTSSGLPGTEGENLAIAGLVDITKVYALVAASVCGAAAA